MIQFPCPCGRQLQARDEDAGRKSKCPACGEVSTIPASQAVTADEGPGDEGLDRREDVTSGLPERPRGALQRERPDEDDREDDRRPRRKRRSEEAEGTSGKASAAMILGLLAFPFCIGGILTGIPAIVLGAIALSDIGKSGGRLGGKAMAITGLVTGALSILTIPIMIGLLLPAVQKVRESAARMQDANNLKQMGIAMHNMHDVYGYFPKAGAFVTKDGKPGLSWRVAILPYIEQDNLYKQFKLDEAWDSPANKPLLGMMPKTYLTPGQVPDGSGMTHYQVFVGPGSIFDDRPLKKPGGQGPPMGGFGPFAPPQRGIGMMDITDGTSNTILITEAQKLVPWTKPEDVPFDPAMPLPPLGGQFGRGYNVLFADGSVHFFPQNTPESSVKAMITCAGGELISPP